MTRKLCVFPNDPIKSYFEKGEIKENYFNPGNIFDEIHIISLFGEDITPEKVQKIAGNAKLEIHSFDKINLINYKQKYENIKEFIKKINPDIIRSFNPLIQGWFAVKISQELKIPVVISIHTNYDQNRSFLKKTKILSFIKMKYTSLILEKYSIENADYVICVYKYLQKYVQKFNPKRVEIVYNKVNLKKFFPMEKINQKSEFFKIISVGQLIEQKDHSLIIKAIKKMEDVRLQIIGRGHNKNKLKKVISDLKLENRVEIIESVDNEKLNEYYNNSDLYIQPMTGIDGIPIPVLEAMASGLPIIMSKHSESYKEDIDEGIIFVENDVEVVSREIQRLKNSIELINLQKLKSLNEIKKISGDKMEINEVEIYKKLLNKN